MNAITELADVVKLIQSDPAGAADKIDDLVVKLKNIAAQLRRKAESDYCSHGGAGDRVRIQVVGPDGTIKQTVDTGEQV